MIFKKTAALLLSLLFLLTACGRLPGGVDENSIELYFLDLEGKNMVTEIRAVPDYTEDVLTYALNELLNGPAAADHRRVIPENTRLIDVEVRGSTATVNLSPEFDTGENISKLWSRYTLINTVCSVKGIEKTQILVEGKKITSISSGEPLGKMGKEDIVTDTTKIEGNAVRAVFYYADSNVMYLFPEEKQVISKEGEKIELTIMNELLKGPQSKELYSVIPPDVKILSAETKDRVCFVNLSSDFISKASGGSSGELLAVYSIVNTLCELKNIDKVQILVEGKKRETFGGMDLSQPLEPYKEIISE